LNVPKGKILARNVPEDSTPSTEKKLSDLWFLTLRIVGASTHLKCSQDKPLVNPFRGGCRVETSVVGYLWNKSRCAAPEFLAFRVSLPVNADFVLLQAAVLAMTPPDKPEGHVQSRRDEGHCCCILQYQKQNSPSNGSGMLGNSPHAEEKDYRDANQEN
jgi:hypothetical protein